MGTRPETMISAQAVVCVCVPVQFTPLGPKPSLSKDHDYRYLALHCLYMSCVLLCIVYVICCIVWLYCPVPNFPGAHFSQNYIYNFNLAVLYMLFYTYVWQAVCFKINFIHAVLLSR